MSPTEEFNSKVDDWSYASLIKEKAAAQCELSYALQDLVAERRARNTMATLALVGWVLALAALGGVV